MPSVEPRSRAVSRHFFGEQLKVFAVRVLCSATSSRGFRSAGTLTWLATSTMTTPGTSRYCRGKRPSSVNAFSRTAKPSRLAPLFWRAAQSFRSQSPVLCHLVARVQIGRYVDLVGDVDDDNTGHITLLPRKAS